MRAFRLCDYNKTHRLQPSDTTGNTPEFVMENSDLCLLDSLVENGLGGYVHRYRLHSRNAMRFEDTLEYDITCPHCQRTTLRLCGRPLDWYDQGLYKCPVCDKK